MSAPTIASTSQGTGTSITYPTGLVAGDLLVIWIGEGSTGTSTKVNPAPTITDSNSKAYTKQGSTGPFSNSGTIDASALYTRVWDGTEGALTISDDDTLANTFNWLCLRLPNTLVDAVYTASYIQTSGTTFSFPSITTTVADTLVLLFGMAGVPTSGLDTATVSGFSRVGSQRATTVNGIGIWSATQASAGASGTNTSSTVATNTAYSLGTITAAFKSGVNNYTQTVHGATTPQSTIRKAISHFVRISTTPAASIIVARKFSQTLKVATSLTASLKRETGKIVRAATTPTKSLWRYIAKNVRANAAPATKLLRALDRRLTANSSPLAKITRSGIKYLQASITPISMFAKSVHKIKVLTANASPIAAMMHVANKLIRATTAPVKEILRAVARTVSAQAVGAARVVKSTAIGTLQATSIGQSILHRMTSKMLQTATTLEAFASRIMGKNVITEVAATSSLLSRFFPIAPTTAARKLFVGIQTRLILVIAQARLIIVPKAHRDTDVPPSTRTRKVDP